MTYSELVAALRRMKVETGSLVCLGCGREHNCSTHGCAIMREAAQAIEQLMVQEETETQGKWIPVSERVPESFKAVIVCREKGYGQFAVEQGQKDVKDWWKVYGARTKRVTHWMPLPEPPEEE